MIPHHKVQKPHLLAATQAPPSHSLLPLNDNIGDPDPHPDPYVFGPAVSAFGSVSQKYRSESGSFHHQAKIVRKTLISTVLWLLFDFLSLKIMKNVQDPYVFGPAGSAAGSVSQRYGSGSGSFHYQAKIVRKPLIFAVLQLIYDFLSLKNDVNVPVMFLGHPDPHPDLLARGTDPRIRVWTKMSRISNTAFGEMSCLPFFLPWGSGFTNRWP